MSANHGGIFSVWLDGDEPERIENWIHNSLVFGKWLGRPVHFCCPESLRDRFRKVGARMAGFPSRAPLFSIGTDHHRAERDIVEGVQRSSSSLLILPTPSEYDHKLSILNWQQIPKKIPVPTAFFPTESRLGQPPFSNLIVPVSGELKENLALEIGLNIADEKGIPVDLIHISPEGTPSHCVPSLLESIGDEVQHEYAERIEQLIAKGSPFSSLQKKRHIREFRHGFGEVPVELKKMIHENPHSLLFVDWSGSLEDGRAEIIKEVLLTTGVCAVLIKSPPQTKARLKVGRDLVQETFNSLDFQ